MKRIRHSIAYLVNHCTKKRKNQILLYPHRNCLTDGYDLINYSSDNVLCVARYILNDERFVGYRLIMIIYNNSRLEDYMAICSTSSLDVAFIYYRDTLSIFKAFMHSSVILTDHPHYNFDYKTKNQSVISLGYFTPFKDDYFAIQRLPQKEREHLRKITNTSIDYHIVTSSLAGRIIAADSLLEFGKFLDLGFPRNDTFYNENEKKKTFGKLHDQFNVDFEKVIVYTPTYRDFEKTGFMLSDVHLKENKSIFGNRDPEDDLKIEEILKQKNAILIAKLHPYQEKSVILDSNYSRIKLYSDIPKELNISLYNILSVSDCLVTDYTSTSFDYLLTEKPILYYFYDYDKYIKNRGFSFSPITSMCAGEISYTFDDFLHCLRDFDVNHKTEKVDFVNNLINFRQDGQSTKRICDFIVQLLTESL